MVRHRLCMGLLIAVIGMVGCVPSLVPSVRELNIAYTPSQSLTKVETKSPKRIKIEPFTDERKRVLLGQEWVSVDVGTISLLSKADVEMVITDATKIELANQGYQIVEENEDLILSGAVLVLWGRFEVGFVSGYVEGKAQLRVAVKEPRQHKIVWSETVNGKSEVKYGMFANTYTKFEEAMNLSIKDLIENLLKSESLHAALK